MRRALLAAAAAALFAGCVPEVAFDVEVEANTVVEGATAIEQLAGRLGFGSFVTFDFSDTREFQNRDVRKDQVTSTRLTRLTLSITSPQGQDFDFIDEISFIAEAPGVESKTVATKQVPENVTSFELDLVDVDLAPYVRAESMSLNTDVTGRRPLQDTTVHAEATFAITAKVLAE